MTHSVLTGIAEAESELLLRNSRRRANVLDSLAYIPGSALLGYYAQRWRQRHGEPDSLFRRIFQSGQVRFANAYPLSELTDRTLWPAPLTLRTCKTHKLQADHRTLDLARHPASEPPRCDHDAHGPGGALKRVRGWIGLDGAVAWGEPPMMVRTQTATYADDRARPHGLYTRRMLARGNRFGLRLEGPTDLLEALAGMLEPNDDEADEILVGGDRTTAGRLRIRWDKPVASDPALVDGQRDTHTLTCLSDVILLDEHLRSFSLDHPRGVAEALGVQPSQVDVVASQVRTVTAAGWSAVHDMPKPLDVASVKGSVVTVTVDAEASQQLAASPAERWVGWRCAEGFGHLAVNWAAHDLTRWELIGWEPVSPPAVDSRRENLAADAARLAGELAEGGHDNRYELEWAVTRSLWQGIAAELRCGRHPTPPEERRLQPPSHAQSASGHGSGSGRRQRVARRNAIERFDEACRQLGIDATGAVPAEAVQFADDIAKELDLLFLRGTAASGARR